MKYSIEEVLNILQTVKDPESGKDLISLNAINSLSVEDNKISFSLDLPAGNPFLKSIEKACKNVIKEKLSDSIEVDIKSIPKIQTKTVSLGRTDNQEVLPGVKNIIAIASGKVELVNQQFRQTWQLHLQKQEQKLAYLMLMFTDLRNQKCLV